jgi:hypothetical protein
MIEFKAVRLGAVASKEDSQSTLSFWHKSACEMLTLARGCNCPFGVLEFNLQLELKPEALRQKHRIRKGMVQFDHRVNSADYAPAVTLLLPEGKPKEADISRGVKFRFAPGSDLATLEFSLLTHGVNDKYPQKLITEWEWFLEC